MRSDTTPAGARDLPAIWAETGGRIIELVRRLPGDAGGVVVPTVPGTTIRDVLAHLIGTATEATDHRAGVRRGPFTLPSANGAPWDATPGELLTEWEKVADKLHGHIGSDPQLASVLITDAAMSEHDLRTALDAPGARDDVAIKVALDELSGRFSDRVATAALPPLRVTVEQWGTIVGVGHAISCVVADRFEFVRAMSGRRSAAEVRRWNWGVDPDAYLPVISEVGLPARDIHERDPRIPEHMRDREFVL
ncbi:maleylpyruvate isomerase mycothiol-dependent enzyme family protein [Mycobacterium branderi]|uniref:Mycothiol-dependent maleylpyruvate isomerase metal-binding domain-containing protein n=1 Tax=Mycobacterium branderi TaxID=43348 RepID=A0A7I7WG58_9MYCO|nr:hypothetical protein [Mycobacterium branderi]MCV7231568.1 hypothetical protein [Mycobacterium branderi]ORA40434.1 hypothetical protein BST20_07890 [Mycobacterium branderi]BBZ14948.1 hypothetical protein MBRA_51430 [Mycobacterium branderi]